MDNKFAGRIPLADMIEALRAELYEAVSRSRTEAIRFGIEKLDVELSVQVSRSAEGSAGIKFWVVSAEAGAKASSTDTHKVHITLLPVDAAGKVITISSTTTAEPK
jgi:Trypsin-co-occurring domain 2